MTLVKICGLTNLADAQFAADCSADFLGFIFYPPSPRYISPEQVREVVQGLTFKVQSSRDKVQSSRFKVQGSETVQPETLNLKPETLDLKPETLNLKPQTLNLQPATLNLQPALVGVFVNQSADFIRRTLDDCGLDLAQLHGDEPAELMAQLGGRAFKAVKPQSPVEAETAAAEFIITPDDFILLDAFHPTLHGGSGLTTDWAMAAQIAARHKILLAGGLTPENVAGAVQSVRPWAVDVSSGVEASKGRKDPQKVKAFIEVVRLADGRSIQ